MDFIFVEIYIVFENNIMLRDKRENIIFNILF